MGQKLSSKLLFISSPKWPHTDGFTDFYISQGSVATQLRCDGRFSNHFITNFSQNAPVKKLKKSVSIWQRYGQKFMAYFFWATLYISISLPRSTWFTGPQSPQICSIWPPIRL